MTHEEFLEKFYISNTHSNSIVILSMFTGSKCKLKCKCKTCNAEWFTRADQLLYMDSGCPNCAREKRKQTGEEFLRKFYQNNPHANSIKLMGEFEESKKKMLCKCLICGNMWEVQPKDLLRGHGCQKCGLKNFSQSTRKSYSDFLLDFSKNNSYSSSIEIVGPYEGVSKRIKCRCNICGNEWNPIADNLVRKKYGCPRCAHIGTSFMEQIVFHSLKRILPGQVQHRDRKAIGKELDIYLPSKRAAIEIGSWAWHGNPKSINKDLLKRELCAQKGIRLFIIYDSVIDREAFLKYFEDLEDVFSYEIDLGSQEDLRDLKLLVQFLLKELNIYRDFSVDDWNEIIAQSTESARRKTHELFVKELSTKNEKMKNISILNQFVNMQSYLHCVCNQCGYSWKTSASALWNNGAGCPRCAGNAPLTQDLFLQEFQKKNPHAKDITVLGTYKSYKSRVSCLCKKCNYQWETTAAHLIGGTGCPACANNCKFSEEDFLERFKVKNKHSNEIIILDPYIGMNNDITCQCKNCAHIWISKPKYLLYQNAGCPLCKKSIYGSWSTKSKKDIIATWKKQHPQGTIKQCFEETKITLKTIYKWWNTEK